jgi:hypothetical protein
VYHLAVTVVAAWFQAPVALLFVLLLVRAVVLPRRSMTPKQVGLGEIGASMLLLLLVAVTM